MLVSACRHQKVGVLRAVERARTDRADQLQLLGEAPVRLIGDHGERWDVPLEEEPGPDVHPLGVVASILGDRHPEDALLDGPYGAGEPAAEVDLRHFSHRTGPGGGGGGERTKPPNEDP